MVKRPGGKATNDENKNKKEKDNDTRAHTHTNDFFSRLLSVYSQPTLNVGLQPHASTPIAVAHLHNFSGTIK